MFCYDYGYLSQTQLIAQEDLYNALNHNII